MKIKRRKKFSASESSAASDVAFLLIIYFLVIAGFNINQGFLLSLPAKDSTRLILKDDLLRFEMDSRGSVLYLEDKLDISDAEKIIHEAVSINPNLAVVLTIDPLAPWQSVVYFVEMAQKLNVDSFSFNMKDRS